MPGPVQELQIVRFIDDRGKSPFSQWLDTLEVRPEAIVLRRIERFRNRAATARAESDAAYEDSSRMASAIPFPTKTVGLNVVQLFTP